MTLLRPLAFGSLVGETMCPPRTPFFSDGGNHVSPDRP